MQVLAHKQFEHLEKVLKQDREFKMFKLKVMNTIYRHASDPLKTPRELAVLYELYLNSENSHHLRKIVKFVNQYALIEKYPWLKQIIDETEKMIQELEKLEEEELELKIKELL